MMTLRPGQMFTEKEKLWLAIIGLSLALLITMITLIVVWTVKNHRLEVSAMQLDEMSDYADAGWKAWHDEIDYNRNTASKLIGGINLREEALTNAVKVQEETQRGLEKCSKALISKLR